MGSALDEATFIGLISDYFELDPSIVDGSASLVDDLHFDSIMLLEIVLFLEERAGRELDDDLLVSLVTVSDVYHYYSVFCH